MSNKTGKEDAGNRLPIRVIINATTDDYDNQIINNKLMNSSMFNGPPGTTFYIPNQKLLDDTNLQKFLNKIISKTYSNKLTDTNSKTTDKLAALEILREDFDKYNTKFNEYCANILLRAKYLKYKVIKQNTHIPQNNKQSDIIKYNNRFIVAKLTNLIYTEKSAKLALASEESAKILASELAELASELASELDIPISYIWYRNVTQSHESYNKISSSHSDCLNIFEIVDSFQKINQKIKECKSDAVADGDADVVAVPASTFYISCPIAEDNATHTTHKYIICYYCKKYILPEYCSEEKYITDSNINKIKCLTCGSEICIENKKIADDNTPSYPTMVETGDTEYTNVINTFAVIVNNIKNIKQVQKKKNTKFLEILNTQYSVDKKKNTEYLEKLNIKSVDKKIGKIISLLLPDDKKNSYTEQFKAINSLFVKSNTNPTSLNDYLYIEKLNEIFLYFEQLVNLVCYQPRAWVDDIIYINRHASMYHQITLYNNEQIAENNIKFFFNTVFAPSTQITLDKKEYMILDLHGYNKNPNADTTVADALIIELEHKTKASKIKHYTRAIKRFYDKQLNNFIPPETKTDPLRYVSEEKRTKVFEYIAKQIETKMQDTFKQMQDAEKQDETKIQDAEKKMQDTFTQIKTETVHRDFIVNVIKESADADSDAAYDAMETMLDIFNRKPPHDINRNINQQPITYRKLIDDINGINDRMPSNTALAPDVTEYFVNISLSQYLIDENTSSYDCNNSKHQIINGLSSFTKIDLTELHKKIEQTVKKAQKQAQQKQAQQKQSQQTQAQQKQSQQTQAQQTQAQQKQEQKADTSGNKKQTQEQKADTSAAKTRTKADTSGNKKQTQAGTKSRHKRSRHKRSKNKNKKQTQAETKSSRHRRKQKAADTNNRLIN